VARALAGLDGAGHRDLAMAESVRWIRNQEADRGRLFVFASDGHVRRGPWTYAEPGWRAYPSMGERLAAAGGDEVFVVGTVHGRGRAAAVGGAQVTCPPAAAESVAGVLAEAGRSAFVVDLRRPAQDVGSRRLQAERPLRTTAGHLDEPIVAPAVCFDAIAYIDRVSPVRPIGEDV
jgi:erythromycin esterase-like protein